MVVRRGRGQGEESFEMRVNGRALMHGARAEQPLEDVLFHLVDIAEEEDDLRVFDARRTPVGQPRLSLTFSLFEGVGNGILEKSLAFLVDDHLANEIETDLVDLQGFAARDQRFDLLDVVLGRMQNRCRCRGQFVGHLKIFGHVDLEAILDHADDQQTMPDAREKKELVAIVVQRFFYHGQRQGEGDIAFEPIVDTRTDHWH